MSAEPGYPLEVRTERLLLRRFAEADLDAWHRAVFADPDVMRFLPSRAPVPGTRWPIGSDASTITGGVMASASGRSSSRSER